jgi:NAD(P)-dependent dehydrogenase (short-subunit alcohol dehydrogenase family)
MNMKVALVTGAGKGLGLGFAQFLSANGYMVYAGIHNMKADCSKTGPNIKQIALDVQNDESIKEAISLIGAEQGKIDLLVNNAGVNKDTATSGSKELVTRLDTLDRAMMLKMFDINSVSPLMMAKYALKLMKNDSAFIINISSDRGSFENAMNDSIANYGYKASKAALNMVTKVLVFDLPKNVNVVAVHPGWVRSNMSPVGTLQPDQAAAKIYKIIADWNPKMNGRFVHNDGSPYAR